MVICVVLSNHRLRHPWFFEHLDSEIILQIQRSISPQNPVVTPQHLNPHSPIHRNSKPSNPDPVHRRYQSTEIRKRSPSTTPTSLSSLTVIQPHRISNPALATPPSPSRKTPPSYWQPKQLSKEKHHPRKKATCKSTRKNLHILSFTPVPLSPPAECASSFRTTSLTVCGGVSK